MFRNIVEDIILILTLVISCISFLLDLDGPSVFPLPHTPFYKSLPNHTMLTLHKIYKVPLKSKLVPLSLVSNDLS